MNRRDKSDRLAAEVMCGTALLMAVMMSFAFKGTWLGYVGMAGTVVWGLVLAVFVKWRIQEDRKP